MVQITAPDSSVGRALTRDLGVLGSNPVLVHNYFSHHVTFGAVPIPGTDMLTPAGEEPGVIVENEDHLMGGRNMMVRAIQILAPDNSVG